jgi:RNA polymerase-binding protein DksA
VAKKSKKVSKKKTSSRSKKGKYLTKAELNHFKKLLLEKRQEILSDVTKIENESLKKSRLDATGDLSNVPIHMADIGTDNFEQEFALDLMDSERRLLDEIHRALERIEDGTYGICEGTGKQIPKARLKAQPWAKYCVEYARMIEQGLVPEG